MNGWVEACANGQVGCMGGLIDGVGMGGWVGCMGGFIHGCRNGNVVSKCIIWVTVMGDPMNLAF